MMKSVAAAVALFAGAGAAAAQPAPSLDSARLRAVIQAAKFSGDIAAATETMTFRHAGKLDARPPRAGDAHLWRWASVTKQVVAVLVMQEVAAGRVALDAPISRYLPAFRGANASRITVRQLLQHQSGLPDPSAGATGDEVPAFYRRDFTGSRDPLTGFCAGTPRAEPGGQWSYNNCDYILLGAMLEAVTGKPWSQLVQERIAKPLKLRTLSAFPTRRWVRPGNVRGAREPEFDHATFGASAALYGSIGDMIAFDRALVDGKLLPPDARATMWEGNPKLGYMALGQWVFPARLAGCAEPVNLVERRGAVGGIQVRNFIAPDRKAAVAILSDQAEFDFGEIWQGKGFSHDLLSAALCPAPTPAPAPAAS